MAKPRTKKTIRKVEPKLTQKAVLKRFEAVPKTIRDYFKELPSLLDKFPLDVAIGYIFMGIEKAQNRALLGGLLVNHKTNAEVTRTVLNRQHIKRESFEKFYGIVFGEALDKSVLSKLRYAERIRDRVIHGKIVSEADKRKAVVSALEHCEGFAKLIPGAFNPFGDLRGICGRRVPLAKPTTRWVLKGMGFDA